jgi:hypothetical protein
MAILEMVELYCVPKVCCSLETSLLISPLCHTTSNFLEVSMSVDVERLAIFDTTASVAMTNLILLELATKLITIDVLWPVLSLLD